MYHKVLFSMETVHALKTKIMYALSLLDGHFKLYLIKMNSSV